MTVLLSQCTLLHPLLLFLLSREKVAVAISQRIQVFHFGSLHMRAQIYITYSHEHIYTYTLTQAYLHTGV